MSKIYEALRQAELDRQQRNQTEPEPAPRSASAAHPLLDVPPAPPTPPAVRTSATLSAVPRPIPDRAGPSQIPVYPVPPVAGEGQATGTPIFDREAARRCTWKPSLYKLPALEERGIAVEQFRSLRSRMYEFRDLNALKSVLVSSGLPQEGKSFIAANLAISFARHKAAHVLLIDGDMRRAALHKLLGCSSGPGLTDFLAGKATIAEIMQRPDPEDPDNPLPHGLATLSFIPAGDEHEKAADLSGNHRFEQLIAAVAPFFDWIVVDSSPVNLVSDGVNLARACDAVLLVARGCVTKFETAQRAMSELKASKILGFVLNAVEDPPAAGGYYGYYGYDKQTK